MHPSCTPRVVVESRQHAKETGDISLWKVHPLISAQGLGQGSNTTKTKHVEHRRRQGAPGGTGAFGPVPWRVEQPSRFVAVAAVHTAEQGWAERAPVAVTLPRRMCLMSRRPPRVPTNSTPHRSSLYTHHMQSQKPATDSRAMPGAGLLTGRPLPAACCTAGTDTSSTTAAEAPVLVDTGASVGFNAGVGPEWTKCAEQAAKGPLSLFTFFPVSCKRPLPLPLPLLLPGVGEQ